MRAVEGREEFGFWQGEVEDGRGAVSDRNDKAGRLLRDDGKVTGSQRRAFWSKQELEPERVVAETVTGDK